MVDERQAEWLRKLKALLDSGAITEEEFAKAKKSLLAESAGSTITRVESTPPKNFELLGFIGLLALILPWSIVYLEIGGFVALTLFWHLFEVSWLSNGFAGIYFITEASPDYLILSVIGFVLALTGSILLLKREKIGGALLLGSFVNWIITYVYQLSTGLFSIYIPIGALMCVIVGIISLLPKKQI